MGERNFFFFLGGGILILAKGGLKNDFGWRVAQWTKIQVRNTLIIKSTSVSTQLTLRLTHPKTSLAKSKLTTISLAHEKKV